MTTYKEAIKKAVAERDANAVGKLAESLRLRGLNYDGIYQMAHRLTGIELNDWETLLYESEDSSDG